MSTDDVDTPGASAMTQTFDIRFARSAGLAALLEVPENVFRWKGGGHLRIDAHGISISVKRRLSALLGGKHTHRIPRENLRAVYREGEALRVEFQSGEEARVVVPFWADDRETAQKIVRLLPTSQTVELEHSTDVTRSGKSRADWRAIAIVASVVVMLVAGSWWTFRDEEVALAPALAATESARPVASTASPDEALLPEMPDATRALDDNRAPAVEASAARTSLATGSSAMAPPASGSVATKPAESSDTPEFLDPPPFEVPRPGRLPLPAGFVLHPELVVPVASGTAAYEVAKLELSRFGKESAALEAAYRNAESLMQSRAITPEQFAENLDELEMRSWNTTFRIFDTVNLSAPELLDLRATMLAAERLRRNFFRGYADGIRERDHVKIAMAFDEYGLAEEMQARARLFAR